MFAIKLFQGKMSFVKCTKEISVAADEIAFIAKYLSHDKDKARIFVVKEGNFDRASKSKLGRYVEYKIYLLHPLKIFNF